MTIPPTESGEGDPGPITRIAEEFIRLHEQGQLTDLDEFCARYAEDQQDQVRQECEQLLRIQGIIKQPDRLTPGQTLASYEIVEPIGKGGMGEVYRARDSKLDRDIAIKVLPPELACQPERVKRFEREAKAVAALDHPNIVTVYSVEESDGLHFITMQLVQGKMLSELIPRKGLPLEKFFDLAIPLADAISSAHEQGITHRDLKPANIMVTADGRVEILDFGLAKLRPQITAEGPTQMPLSSLTVEGQIVGTVAYMSPEQAEGRDVDHRTDIFSLGIILYEMVTGQRPFKGETRVALMSSIMKDTPTAVRQLIPQVPNHLGRIIRRSLEKDPEHRFQTSKDLRNELADLRKEVESGETIALSPPAPRRRWLWPTASGALLAALLLILVLPEPPTGPRLLGDPRPITDLPGLQRWPSLSPDGDDFVYTDPEEGNGDIFSQPVEGGRARNLTDDNPQTNDKHATFHPTENRIAFQREGEDGGLFVMDVTGDQSSRFIDEGYHPDWSPDDRLVYTTKDYPNAHDDPGPPGELKIVDYATGVDRRLFAAGRSPFHPNWSPDGKWIAFAVVYGGNPVMAGQRDIWIISPAGGEPIAVTDDVHTDWGPFWSPNGRLLFFISDREGQAGLWWIRIDENTGERQGDPQRLWTPTMGRLKEASISRNGLSIVCTVELVTSGIWKFEFDLDSGARNPNRIFFTNKDPIINLSVSPDDDWLSFATWVGVEDLFVIRADGSDNERALNLTDDPYKDRQPTWYPHPIDGDVWLTFFSNREGSYYQIYAIRPDMPAGLIQLTVPGVPGGENIQPRWWFDGTRLLSGTGGLLQHQSYQFPNGLLPDRPLGGRVGERRVPDNAEREKLLLVEQGQGGFPGLINENGSWSPNGKLFAQTPSNQVSPAYEPFQPLTRLRIYSTDGGYSHDVAQPDETPYNVRYQAGPRWLDNTRLIFWDLDLNRAFLWNVETKEATPTDGIEEPGEFVFSSDGQTLYALQWISQDSDIWLLNLDPESIK